MMTWATVSADGFSSTGFMSMAGSKKHARDCNAWARPISPPSTVTALFNAMFCGLNGATATPRRASARHNPAANNDLPASEVQP